MLYCNQLINDDNEETEFEEENLVEEEFEKLRILETALVNNLFVKEFVYTVYIGRRDVF